MATPRDTKKTVTLVAQPTAQGWGSVQHYRQEGGAHVIDISAGSIAHLFSGLDPAPFRHRDLDPQVDAYIMSAVREIGDARHAKLVIHLPPDQENIKTGEGLAEAVHNYFAYREWVVREELRRMWRTGAASMAIGLAFLIVCMLVRELLLHGDNTASRMLNEGLLIVGWVALWRPLEIALYDWWPLWRTARSNALLKAIPVDVRPLPER
jgi:hypothetical protein